MSKCHELVDIDCAILVCIHFQEDGIQLLICHVLMTRLDDEVLEPCFVDELVAIEHIVIFISWILRIYSDTFCDLLFEKSTQIFHLVFEVEDLALLTRDQVILKLSQRNATIAIGVKLVDDVMCFLLVHLA